MIENRYIDIDLNFSPHPVTKDVVRKFDREAIRQSVKNLVLYNFYEKWNPDIGSNVKNLLFEPMTIVTTTHLKRSIEQTIENFESRVELLDVIVNPDPENNAYDVRINFNLINVEAPFEIEFLLRRVR